jgi:hypothetical protein
MPRSQFLTSPGFVAEADPLGRLVVQGEASMVLRENGYARINDLPLVFAPLKPASRAARGTLLSVGPGRAR